MHRKAKHLPQFLNIAPWKAILADNPPFRVLEENRTADVVIIGAGFAGLSAARRLLTLNSSMDIVILDALAIAEGTAGRNSGFMIDLPHVLTSEDYAGADDSAHMTALNRQAIEFAAESITDYRINPAYFDRRGKINGAVGKKAHCLNRDYAARLKAAGEPHKMLDQQQMFALTGSRYYQSGLYTPGTVLLQPAGYILGLAKGLDQQAAVYEKTPVTAFRKEGSSWRIDTPKGCITCKNIMLANNGHLESFGYGKNRLLQLFLYASMTKELDTEALKKLGGEPLWGITPADPMGTTMRKINTPLGGNRIIARTCANLRSDMQMSKADVKRAAYVHQQKFDQRFPQLVGAAMEFQWAGHLCLSMNDVSMIGELEEGLFSACVQNGLGTARGTLTGIAAAELLCQHSSPISDHFTHQAAPKRLAPRPFRDWGANAYLAYQEWRAKEE